MSVKCLGTWANYVRKFHKNEFLIPYTSNGFLTTEAAEAIPAFIICSYSSFEKLPWEKTRQEVEEGSRKASPSLLTY